jgi:hypothetical protein
MGITVVGWIWRGLWMIMREVQMPEFFNHVFGPHMPTGNNSAVAACTSGCPPG